MKNLKSILFLSILAAAFTGCEEDNDKFSGSPVGNNNIVMLKGELDTGDELTDVDFALTNQEIDFTVTLPQKFADTVNVEVTTISDSGRRIRQSVEIKPDSIVKKGKIRAAGGAIFDTNFKMYISGISLQTAQPYGTHYLMTSDTITIGTGSSVIPDQNTSRLIVKVVWLNPSTSNNLQLVVDRPIVADAIPTNLTDGKTHSINIANTGTGNQGTNNNISWDPGEYIYKIKASALTVSPIDMPYRVIAVFPDGQSKVFSGTLQNLTTATPLTDVAKVVKNADGTFVITDLTN